MRGPRPAQESPHCSSGGCGGAAGPMAGTDAPTWWYWQCPGSPYPSRCSTGGLQDKQSEAPSGAPHPDVPFTEPQGLLAPSQGYKASAFLMW